MLFRSVQGVKFRIIHITAMSRDMTVNSALVVLKVALQFCHQPPCMVDRRTTLHLYLANIIAMSLVPLLLLMVLMVTKVFISLYSF